MSFDIAKALAIINTLPALLQIANQGVQAVEATVPHTGVVGQKIDMVNQYIDKGTRAVMAGVQEVDALIPIATTFASQLLTLYEQIKTGQVVATLPMPAAPPVAPPSPAH